MRISHIEYYFSATTIQLHKVKFAIKIGNPSSNICLHQALDPVNTLRAPLWIVDRLPILTHLWFLSTIFLDAELSPREISWSLTLSRGSLIDAPFGTEIFRSTCRPLERTSVVHTWLKKGSSRARHTKRCWIYQKISHLNLRWYRRKASRYENWRHLSLRC